MTAAVFLSLASLLAAQTEIVTGAAATDDDIRRAVVQLGADEFEVRQNATEFLWSVGGRAESALEEALESGDAEIRLRAQSILERFRYGIFIDTPPDEVRLINQFRAGEMKRAFQELARKSRLETLLALLDTVRTGTLRAEMEELVLNRLQADGEYETLLDLATSWRAEAESAEHLTMLEKKLRALVPHLLLQDRIEQAELILRDAATSDDGIRDWAVYCLLTDQLDQEITQLESRTDVADLEHRQLVYFLRAKGELEQARSHAEQLTDPTREVLRGLLFELRDWPALADLQRELLLDDPLGLGRNVEALGYAAAFYRLAGRQEDFENAIESIKGVSKLRTTLEWNSGEALVINGRIDEGIEILKPRMPAIAFQMLSIQERYGEAFQLAGLANPREDHSRWFEYIAAEITSDSPASNRQYELAVHVIEALHRLGETEAASKYIDILSRSVEHDRSGKRLHELCKMEMRAGLWDRAIGHAVLVMSRGRYPDPVATLFPSQTETAHFWRDALADTDSMEGREALNETGKMLGVSAAGTLDAQVIDQRIASAARWIRESDQADKGNAWHSLAQTCFLHDRDDLGAEYLQLAADSNSAAAVKLGDRFARQRDFETAGNWYRHAWELDEHHYLARYLQGHMLKQAGQEEEGQRLIDSAVLLPLADVAGRRQLASGLNERDLRSEAIKQWTLVLRSGGFMVSLSGKFRDTSVVDAAQNIGNSLGKDPLGRAQYWRTMHLSCLESQLWIPSFRGYFRTPHIMHQTRAAAYLEADQIEDALAAIREGEPFLPANTEFVEQLVPKLDKADQADEAEALFTRYYDRVAAIAELFPNSALHHNNLAWMSARCDRRLDDALRHVQRALELVPDSAAYLDTLGEVHFRRGELDQAIECAQRCLELDPDNRFYREQLERFQKARSAS